MFSVVEIIHIVVILLLFDSLPCYSDSMPDTPFRVSFGISKADCVDKCNKDSRCFLARYTRRFNKCALYDSIRPKTTRSPGTWTYETFVNKNSSFVCSECLSHEECAKAGMESVCITRECGPPPVISGAKTLGNIYKSGSKVKYECQDNQLSDTMLCLVDGTWSQANITCSCSVPFVNNGESSIQMLDNGTLQLDIVCFQYFQLQQPYPIVCDPVIGIWRNLKYAKCHKVIEGPWRKIYSFPKEGTDDIMGPWRNSNHSFVNDYYRNGSFIDNWLSMPVRDIRLSIVKDEKEAAFIVFNGRNSKSRAWFAKDRIINSSWIDLGRDSRISHLSWYGIKISKPRAWIRYYISQSYDVDVCEQDRGWFAVTLFYYPCGLNNVKHVRILFAQGSNASSFKTNDIGLADRFEFWVN